MVVAKRKNLNFDIPPEISVEFDRLSEGGAGLKKWMVISAAILSLLDLPEDAQANLIWKVAEADLGRGSIGKLIEKAKVGELLDAAPLTLTAADIPPGSGKLQDRKAAKKSGH